MEVGHGQEFGVPLLQPLFFARGLAGGAVTIQAGIIERDLRAALITAVEMAAQCLGSALDEMPNRLAPPAPTLWARKYSSQWSRNTSDTRRWAEVLITQCYSASSSGLRSGRLRTVLTCK